MEKEVLPDREKKNSTRRTSCPSKQDKRNQKEKEAKQNNINSRKNSHPICTWNGERQIQHKSNPTNKSRGGRVQSAESLAFTHP